ncbi:MAG TPA: hypothetical protein H9830_13700 [Candidatus Agrococcus pullicola]|uniref:Uncharacterized protein n=1 Tax=Candidatus Agrococcus pullicola TaxID=2838429 RepID=A0A9D1YY21_9MICO|nr:hypothetical protein [uncultured Agrococcus sp.]HIY67317.1 hypothetical protein [Candidatus Agrococcus pullicola]
MQILMETAGEAAHHIPMYAWVAAGISAGVFLIGFVVFRSFREVANRHAEVPEGAENH